MRIYGVYVEKNGANVLFNRKYEPIARFSGGPNSATMTIPSAVGDPITLQLEHVERVPPKTWIEYVEQRWLYDDATSPIRSRHTRATIKAAERHIGRILATIEV